MEYHIRFVKATNRIAIFHGYEQELKIFFLDMDTPATSVYPDNPVFGPVIVGLYIEKDSDPIIQHPVGMEPEDMDIHIHNLRQAVLFCKEFKKRRTELYAVAKEEVIKNRKKNKGGNDGIHNMV